MILTSLHILLCVGLGIVCLFLGATFGANSHPHSMADLGAAFSILMLIPVLIALGLSIYFLAIVIKFFNEISSGAVSGFQQGVVLQPINTPQTIQQGGGAATVYVPPGAQNVIFQYPQQAPHNPYVQQGYGYQPGIKNPE